MQAIRDLLARRNLGVLICAATLLLKLLVPTGYMVDNDHGHITIIVCSGAAPRTMTMEMPGMHGNMPDHGRAEMPCAFSSLSAAMLGATDPIQVAALIAFILALGLAVAILPAPSQSAYLRPPLRGPPTYL